MKFSSKIAGFIIIPIVATVSAFVLFYFIVSSYVINEAKKHVINTLLSHRGLHHYIQKDMHPEFYKGCDDGYISREYYTPVIFSSSFIVRVLHQYYNEERKKMGMPEVYYKMASNNPRNPLNRADVYESKLIALFNRDRSLQSFKEIVTIDKKRYLYYAIPFLETNVQCLKCHGKRENAPAGLQNLYAGEGGFNEKAGVIRAIESVRVSVDEEISKSIIITGSATSGLVVLLGFVFFSVVLKRKVGEKTEHLQNEIELNNESRKKIKNALHEKEVLLKEIHHRVKNNLAVIASLLELQSMNENDERLSMLLKESLTRIKTMALVHENLYLSDDLGKIEFKTYIERLIKDLAQSCGYDCSSNLCELDIDSVSLNIDTMIHLGLIINEIIMNSFKHAFESISEPKIGLTAKLENDILTLSVSDNGIGFDPVMARKKRTLGMDIIDVLVLGLKAEMVIDSENGTKYTISLNIA